MCMYCQQTVSGCLRYAWNGRVFHNSCRNADKFFNSITVSIDGDIGCGFAHIFVRRSTSGGWYTVSGNFVSEYTNKRAEELYQKYLKWKE